MNGSGSNRFNMKRIKESPNKERWPRCKVNKIECRKRDLIVRIADWTRDKDEPAFDVEVYVGGIYDFNLSQVCKTKTEAIAFASKQIASIL